MGGRPFATSTLSRRSMKGRSTRCSWVTIFALASSSSEPEASENHVSKAAEEPNTSGSKKLSSAHSSCRLFCRGVPVMSRRCAAVKVRTMVAREEFSFFSRCASSTMR